MHVSTILHQHLEPLLQHLHRRRLATLLAAVVSCLSGPRLSLTDLGRRFEGRARLRHKDQAVRIGCLATAIGNRRRG